MLSHPSTEPVLWGQPQGGTPRLEYHVQCVFSPLTGDAVQHSEPSGGAMEGSPKGSPDPSDSLKGKEAVLVSP